MCGYGVLVISCGNSSGLSGLEIRFVSFLNVKFLYSYLHVCPISYVCSSCLPGLDNQVNYLSECVKNRVSIVTLFVFYLQQYFTVRQIDPSWWTD